ncbi:cytochrome P450 [Mycena leptocephala]|nr:cytochrome P450 [Mycena leptocephala]
MITASPSAVMAVLALALSLVFVLVRRKNWIKHIPGPPSPSWIYGNLAQLMLSKTYGDSEFEWQKQYGPVYRIKGCFGQDRLVISDPLSLQFILNGSSFKRGPTLQNTLLTLFGQDSMIAANGTLGMQERSKYHLQGLDENHRRLRAGLASSFAAGAVRKFIPVFARTAEMLTARFEESIKPGSVFDVGSLLNLATLNAAGESIFCRGIGQRLDHEPWEISVSGKNGFPIGERLHDAYYNRLVYCTHPASVLRWTLQLPSDAFTVIRTTRALAAQLGTRLMDEKVESSRRGLERSDDVYSALLQNKTKHRLNSTEAIAQANLLLTAGQDGTANALAFGLHELAKHPEFQERLRDEIHSIIGQCSGVDVAYETMPLLNAFLKEIMRLYPSGPLSEQIAVKDTFLPLANGITTTTGEHITKVPVQKGQIVTLALASYQRLESVWGADAHEFRPERWLADKPFNGEALGPWANLCVSWFYISSHPHLITRLVFFGGPRTCLGKVDSLFLPYLY